MNDARLSFRLPLNFIAGQDTVLAAAPQNDENFTELQLQFIRHLFGRSEYLRANGSQTPISDAVLSTFVTLIDVLIENSPQEARYCATQVRQVLDAVLPPPLGEASH